MRNLTGPEYAQVLRELRADVRRVRLERRELPEQQDEGHHEDPGCEPQEGSYHAATRAVKRITAWAVSFMRP